MSNVLRTIIPSNIVGGRWTMYLNKGISKDRLFLLAVFSACICYWMYLFFNSQMEIVHDAADYKSLGSMIYARGWLEYMSTGPHREPLYPFLVAASMRIANYFSLHYSYIQKFFQIFSLFLTQLMLLAILDQMGIGLTIKALSILYFGFSPAIVNSAFSLFSEIATYPSVLAIVIFGVMAWQAIIHKTNRLVISIALMTALSFLMAVLVKGIFQYVFFVYLIPFTALAIKALQKKRKDIFIKSLIFIVILTTFFQSSVVLYKWVNKKYNGHYAFTNRAERIFYGNVHKRTNLLTPSILLAHLASIPGGKVCRRFFSEDECLYSEFYGADYFALGCQACREEVFGTYCPLHQDPRFSGPILPDLLSGVPEIDQGKKTMQLAFEKIRSRPFQYLLFTCIEAFRMTFWESTQIGFVLYPEPLSALFATKVFKDILRAGVASITLFSLLFILYDVYRRRNLLFDFSAGFSEAEQEVKYGFFSLVIILSFTFLYSLSTILTRFALPIVPIYFLCFAYTSNHLMQHLLSARPEMTYAAG